MHPFAHTALLAIVVTSALGALLMCVLVLQYGFPSPRDEDRGKGDGERRLFMTRMGHATAGACFAVAALLAVVALTLPSRAAAPTSPRADTEIDRLRQELRGMDGRLGRMESQIAVAESRAAAAESRVEGATGRVADIASRVMAAESRVADAEAAAHRAGTEASRALAGVRQLERAAAVEAPRMATSSPRRVAAPVTAPRRLEARADPVPAAASPPTAAPAPPVPPPPVAERVRPRPATAVATAGPSAPAPEPERSLGDKLRDDWKKIKRDTQAAGDDVRGAFRRLRDWLTP